MPSWRNALRISSSSRSFREAGGTQRPNNARTMSCVLRLEGAQFNVKGFLAKSGINAYDVWNSGDQDRLGRRRAMPGCKIAVSEADFNDLSGQIRDAITFLRTNLSALQELSAFGLGTEDQPCLDFAIETRMLDVGSQVDTFPSELLKLAGAIGLDIMLSQYPPASVE